MKRSNILNNLKLLNIRNPWQVSLVKELSNRRGASAGQDPLFRDTKKRMKANKDPTAKKKFNLAIAGLMKHELLYKKDAVAGIRLHLLVPVWELEDAKIESIASSTLALTQGRKNNISWKTILKEVRKNLSCYDISLKHKVTQTLVRYFLVKRCGWKLLSDDNILPPRSISKKVSQSPEQQHDLFGGSSN